MGFKLLRVDVNDACKIRLELGKHLIGRGKFLHCDDKRVSRKHGELEVTDNSVHLKALHTNPCFYVRKGTVTREMLKQNDSVDLGNGDRFGLLPVDCWYEVLYMPDNVDLDQKLAKPETQVENGRIMESSRMLENTEIDNDLGIADKTTESLDLAPQSFNENADEPLQLQSDNEPRPASPNESDMSQSLIQDQDLHLLEPSQNNKPTLTLIQNNPQDFSQNPTEQTTFQIKNEPVDAVDQQNPLKRPLPSMSDVKQEPGEEEAKKIKMEPTDATAGPSNDQNAVKQDFRSGSRVQSTESTKTRLTFEFLDSINDHLDQSRSVDRWDHSAKTWAVIMRGLPKDQQIFAEKLINDVLFEAQLNSLCRESHVEIGLPVKIDLTKYSQM